MKTCRPGTDIIRPALQRIGRRRRRRHGNTTDHQQDDDVIVVDEVYVISQYWGDTVYHRFVETLPRISACISFLVRHPDIRIHVPHPGSRGSLSADSHLVGLLEMLGLGDRRTIRDRLVWGTVLAKVGDPDTYRYFHVRNHMFNVENGYRCMPQHFRSKQTDHLTSQAFQYFGS